MVAGERQVEMRAPTRHQVEAGHGSVRDAATSLRPDAASQALLPPTFQTSAAVMKLIQVSSD